jgi:glycolate oxidase FAD binding subunit
MTVLEPSRPGTAADAIDGITPARVVEPASGQACAAALAAAAAGQQATVLRGGGTKMGWGRPLQSVDLVVSTARLGETLVHRDGDLTATVGAGVTLERLNASLAARGQWLPVDSAFAGATIGGVLATNDAGPLRYRYGTPRDLLIGITLALTDGRVVKAGGTVVKNVAGYDLGKLVTGSYGALAAIVDATFKLLPLPHTSSTLRAVYADPEVLAADALAIAASQLEPLAFDVRGGDPADDVAASDGHPASAGWCLLVRFASSPASVATQTAAARGLLRGSVSVVTGQEESALWAGQLALPWHDPGAVVRCSWMPSRLGEVLALVRELRAQCEVTFVGRAGTGTGLLRLRGSEPALAAAMTRARREASPVGHVVLLHGSRSLKTQIDVWGVAAGAPAMALKRALDPTGILNAGRGPV